MGSQSTIPSTQMLIELMQAGKLHPEGFLDILEKRLEEDPALVTPEDLFDLYRSGRLSEEEYVSYDQSWPDDISDIEPLDDVESVAEQYGRELLE